MYKLGINDIHKKKMIYSEALREDLNSKQQKIQEMTKAKTTVEPIPKTENMALLEKVSGEMLLIIC